MQKCLIAVQGPLQFVSALIAFEWIKKELPKPISIEAVLLMYDFYAPDSVEANMAEAIKNLAASRYWEKVIFISEAQMRSISLNKFSICIDKLKKRIGTESFDEVYIARDYGSFGTQLILNSYPNATHIEYGDSFGLVGTESDLLFSLNDAIRSPLLAAKKILKKVFYQHYPERFRFHSSILSIPIDWSGKYLKDKNLIVPSKEHVIKMIFKLANLLTGLKQYCNSLIEESDKNHTLILLSNFANSGFSTLENETELYYQLIIQYVTEDNIIILKNHPRGNPQVLDRLIKMLSSTYIVKAIDNKKYDLYPIELWASLITHCRILPVFSSSTISLNYIYSKSIELTLDDEKIEKFIFKAKQAETKKAEEMNIQALIALKNWDMNSPVWCGME